MAALAAAVVALLAPLVSAPPAAADHHGPSARQVAAGKAAVAQRERQVRRAAAQLEQANADLARLAQTAEIAVEAYNAARIEQREAATALAGARVVLGAATDRLDQVRDQAGAFASAAYMTGGLSTLDMALTADGPRTLLYRLGTLEALSRSETQITQAFDAARVFQVSVAEQAQVAVQRANAAATAADDARATAQSAVDQQSALLRDVEIRRHHLAVLLHQAREHASALERARLAAIARARAAAAARAARKAAQQQQQQQSSGGSGAGATGTVPGTVSAATEQQAVSYAESQIGKPYEWGADGPDSYDCSGLTMWSYAQADVTIDHWTGYQWREGARISTSAMRPGDLAFFATDTSDPNTIHHVGMYIGNGEMVEAPYTGANVRISSVWRPDLIGVIRPYDR
jgi:cell wall-associated NlpC family hydrolase